MRRGIVRCHLFTTRGPCQEVPSEFGRTSLAPRWSSWLVTESSDQRRPTEINGSKGTESCFRAFLDHHGSQLAFFGAACQHALQASSPGYRFTWSAWPRPFRSRQAAQTTELSALVPIASVNAERLVLVGDHCQRLGGAAAHSGA